MQDTSLMVVSLLSILILGVIAMGLSLSGLFKWAHASWKNKQLEGQSKSESPMELEKSEIDAEERESRDYRLESQYE